MGRVSLRLVVATVFLSFALLFTGVAVFVTQMTGAQSSLPTISFHEITAVREGETAMIMVSVSEPLRTPLPLTLNLVREGSTATRNEDYTLRPSGVKIESGETMAVITIPTLDGGDNSYYEGDETVVLELRLNENRVQFNTPDVRTLTIEDMLPAPTIKLNFEGPVQEGLDKDFTVNLSHAADLTVTVSVAARFSSRAETADYTISPSTFEIAARELTATFTLETVPDGIYEFTETLILEPRASIAAMALKSAPAGGATVVIAESDPIPTVSVSDDVEIDEDTGGVEFKVDLSGALDTTVTLSLRVNDRSTADSDDYDPLPATFEIAARATSFTFTLEITPDEVYELSETLEFDLSFMAQALNLGTFSRVVTIQNDEELPEVSLDAVESLNEGDRHELTVSLSGALQSTATVTLIEQRGGVDYTLSPATVMVPPGVTVTIVTLDVSDDTLYQGRSRELEFIPILDSSPLGLSGVTGDGVVITVLDNDLPPVVMFDPIPDVSKGESGVTTARFAQATQRVGLSDTVGVDLSIIGATEIPEGETVTIGIELDQPLTQPLADDLVINTSYRENVFAGSNFVDISSVAGVREFSTVSNSEAYTETLGFGFRFYGETYDTIAVHTNGFIGFTDDPDDLLNSTGDLDGYRDDNTPAIEGEVVPIVAPLLSIINYRNPDGLEPPPSFYGVRLGAGTADDRYIVQYTNVRVRVDVGVRVPATFQVALYANGRIELRYQDIPSSVQQAAKIGISNGSGTGMYEEFSYIESRLSESDTRIVYTPASKVNAVIKDADGETVTSFGILDIIAVDEVSGTIQLVNRNREDTNWDGDQAYRVELVSASPLVVVTGTVATYTFTDDDLPEVTLEYDMCSTVCDRVAVAEGDSLNLIVRLTNAAPSGAPEAVTVNLAALGGTATETLDYTLPASITIDEDTSQTIFTFSPTDDNLAERTEELVIGISSVEYGDNRLQSSVSFTVFIIDTRPTLSLVVTRDGSDDFESVDYILEGQSLRVIGHLTSPLGQDLELDLVLPHGGTSTTSDERPGNDHITSETFDLDIPGEQTSSQLQVTIEIQDEEDPSKPDAVLFPFHDSLETIIISIELGERSRHLVEQGLIEIGTLTRTIYIVDNTIGDHALALKRPTLSLGPIPDLDEGDSRIITARLSDTYPFPLEVTLSVNPAMSTAREDSYDLSPLVSRIPAGAREVTFELETIDDMVHYASDETLVIEMSADIEIVDLGVTRRSVIIRENDPAPTLRLGEISQSVNEGESLTFTVEVVGSASYTQTLSLVLDLPQARSLNSDQAIDRDLSLSPTSVIVIPADRDGSSPISRFEFTLTANEDDIYEGTESTMLNVVLRDDNGVQIDYYDRTLELIDNEPFPTLWLDLIEDVTEGGVFTGTVRISSALESALLINEIRYVPTGSTAERDDYRSPTSIFIASIASGKTAAVISFPYEAIRDGIYEGTETLVLRPFGFDNDRVNLVGSSSEIMIIDGDDIPTVSLISLGQVREGNDLAITARLSGPLENTVTVELVPTNVNAESGDYTISPARVTILPGATVAKFTLTAHSDVTPIFETTKTLTLNPIAMIVEGSVSLDTDSSSVPHQVMISESLPVPTVSIEAVLDDFEFNEDEKGIEIRAVLEHLTEFTVTVSLSRGAGSTAEDTDFELETGTLEIGAGSEGVKFTLDITDDEFYEGTEVLILEGYATGSGIEFLVISSDAMIIDDEQQPTLSLDQKVASIDESAGVTLTVTLEDGALLETPLMVSLERVVSSTAETNDYTLAPLTALIESGQMTATFRLDALTDEIYENDEQLVLVPRASGVRLAEPGTFTIVNRTPRPVLSFESISDIQEGENGTITVRLNGVLSFTVTVSLDVDSDATTAVSPSEYELVNSSFAIPPGSLTATFNVNTNEIPGVKSDRKLVLDISNDAGLKTDDSVPLVLNIHEGDPIPILSLALTRIGDSELLDYIFEGETLTVGARLTSLLGEDLYLNLLPFSGTATDGTDYSTSKVAVPFVIPSTGDRVSGAVISAILEIPAFFEEPEFIVIGIEVAERSRHLVEQGFLKTGTLTRTIYIVDNDSPKLTLSLEPIAAVDEGDSRIITAILSDTLPFPLKVSLRVNQGLSTLQEDYYRLSPPVSIIPAGAREVTFTLEALYDMVHYTLPELSSIHPIRLALEVNADEQIVDIDLDGDGRRVVRVNDNDPLPTLSFDPVEDVTEGGVFTVTVRLSNMLDNIVIITPFEYVPNAGTAEIEDYQTFGIGTKIPPGYTTDSVVYRTFPDEIYEGTETLVLRPAGNTFVGGATTRLDSINGEITIIDDDPIPTVSLESLGQVSEPNDVGKSDTLTVTVRLSGALESPVTVSLLATNESTDDDDYTISPAGVTIRPGVTVAKFTLTAHSGTIPTFETTETLTLNPVAIIVEESVRLETDSSVPHRVAISEGLPVPTVSIEAALDDFEFEEGEKGIQIKAVLEHLTEFTVTVSLRRGADSTAGDNDFELETSTLEIDPAIGFVFFNLDITEDRLYELTETLIFEGYATGGGIELPVQIFEATINEPLLTLQLSPVVEITEGQSLTFTIEVVGEANYPQTLSLVPYLPQVRPGGTDQATARDLSLSPTSVTIPADSDGSSPISRFEFTLTAKEDNIYEGTESTMLNVVLRDDNGNQVAQEIRDVNIIDNEPFPTLSLDPIEDVTEGGVFTGTVRISSVLESALLISEIRYVTTGSTAEMDDYKVPGNFPLARIDRGKTTAVIPFPYETIRDGIYEGTETLVLRPVGFDNDRVNLVGSRSEITIRDADSRPTVSLDAPGQVAEGGRITVTVRLDGILESTVTVELSPTNGNAESDDYTISPARVTILPGATVAEFTLTAHPDIIPTFETTETLTLNPVAIIVEGSVNLPTDSSVPHRVAISESLPVPTVSIEAALDDFEFNEGEKGIQIRAVLQHLTEFTVTVSLSRGAGSTAGDNDFELEASTLEIDPAIGFVFFNLDITDDALYEGKESLIFEGYATGGGIELRVQPLETTITDENDRPTLIGPVGEVTEGHSTTIEVSLTSILNVPVSVSLAYGVGSTASQNDYTLSEIDAEIAAGKLTATFNLEAVQNELYELTETLILVPSAIGVGLGEITGEPGVITIVDDDALPTVSLDAPGQVAEGDGITVTVRLDGVLESTVTVELLPTNGNAESDDYTISPARVTILPGATVAKFTLTAHPDIIPTFETTETLTLNPVAIIVEGSVSLPTDSSVPHRVAISESLPVPFVVLQELKNFILNEGQQGVQIRALLQHLTEFTVTVSLSRGAGSTAEEEDYELETSTLEIDAGKQGVLFTLDITPDDLYEGDEELVLEGHATGNGLELPIPNPVVMIIDDEQLPTLSLDQKVASIDEGAGVTLTVSLDGKLEVPVTVSLLTGDTSTAKANDDYTLSPLTFRIESGQLTATFRLNALSDKIYEGNEQLVLVPRATGVGIELRAQPLETTIIDNDRRSTLQIGPVGEVTEGESTTIEVSLNSILKVPVRVSLAYGVGSTASQNDYTLSEIGAEIAAGKLTATFSLEAVQNELYELTETLILVPSASGVGLEEITGEPGVITIVDDEAPPTLSFEPLNDLDEGDIGMITVRLNGVALETPLVVTVTVNTVASRINDISPVISPDEYQLIPVVSVIPAGELTATFRLETYHDGRFRGDRTLEIDLVTDNDQVVLAGGPMQVELMELDMVPVLSLDPIPDVLDTRGSFLIEVNLSNLLDNDLDLELTTGLVEGSYIAFLRLIDPVERGRVAVTGIPTGLQTGLITFRPQNVASDQTVTLALQLDDDAINNADLNELEALGLIELGVTSRTFRILDRDVKPVLSLDPVGTIAEGSTNEVTVRLDRPLISDLTVSLTIDSAATLALDRPAEEGDYELPSTSFLIPASALLTTFSLKSIDDDIYEGDEQFVLRLEHEPIDTDQFDLGQDTQIVTIRDDDPPELILDEVVSPVNEGDSFNLTGQLRGARVLPITLSLNTISAASTVGSDEWSVTPQTITVPAGSETYPFSFIVTVKEDSVYEGTERAVFEVTAVGVSERVLNRESFGLVEINDNDTITEISRITIPEGVTEGETFTVVVELNDALGTYLDVSLVHDGTSTAEPKDYQITPPIYRIEAGQTIATLEVEIFDDRLYELTETLVFSITASNTEARIELPMLSRSIEITESEELPRIVLRAIDDPITEGGDGVTVTVRVNGAFEVPLTLSLTTAVTSVAGPDDYSLSPETIVIPAGYKQENVRDNSENVRVEVEFRLTADTDDLYEGPEELILDLIVDTSADPRIDLNRGTFRRATTIMDVNQPPTLVLDGPTEINEGESAEYTLSLTGALGVSLTVSFAPGAATTADPPDYRLPGSEIVILSGNTVAVFTLETVPDDLYEGNEQLELVLSFSGAPVELPEIKQTITIREPRPTVSLEPSSPSVNEGDGVTVTAVLNGGFTEDVDVLLEIVGGTAGVADYVTPSTLRETITAGNTRFAFVITATTDGVYDGLEPETLELGLSVFGQGTPITAAVQTLTITDLETLPTLSLELPPRTVRETDGTLLLTATLSVGLDEDVELSLSVGGDVGEDDYSVAQQFTISAGDVFGTFEFVIKDDRIYEGTEAVELTLNGETTGAVVETLLPFSAEFAIVDDEGPVTIMVISPPSVLEDEEIVIEVELTAIALEDVTVTLVIAETGNAKPADYQLLDPLTRTIGAGDMETTFRIRAESDNLYEGIETIDLQFHALGGIVESTLNIIDANEPPAVRIASAQPTTVTEGASVEILVELDGVLSERDVVVDFTVSGTAVEGTDYTVPGRSVTIPSSRRTAAITLVATDDTVVYSGDASRTVELELTGASGGVTLGDSLTHTVTIIDDDVPVVPEPPAVVIVTATLRVSELSVSEGDTTTLNIDLSEVASEDVTLTLTVVGGSAVESVDYEPLLVPVVIRAGLLELTVSIRTIEDDLTEATETLVLELSVVDGPAVTGAVDRVTVSIVDDDVPVVPEPPVVVM